MTVLLTGATGFVGQTVLRRLLADGRPVRALVRDPARLPDTPGAGPEVAVGSLEDEGSLAAAVEGATAVIHLAGEVAARRRAAFFAVNALGTARLALAARRHAAAGCRWVPLSSLAACGPWQGPGNPPEDRPVSDYGRSKLEGERAAAAEGPADHAVLRAPAVYGPGDTAFLPFFQSVARGRPVPVPAVRGQRFSFVQVEDLAAGVAALLAAESFPVGAVLYPAHPERPTLDEFLARLGEALGRRPRRLPVPPWAAWGLAGALSPFRALTGRPRFLSLDKMNEVTAPAWCCDPAEMEAATGWRAAYDLPAGLSRTVAAYRRAGWLPPGPAGDSESEAARA